MKVHTFLFCFLLPLFSLAGASDSSQLSIDTTIHSVKKAVLFSAVIPGAGKIYKHISMPKGKKRAYWKASVIYGGKGTQIYFLTFNQNKQKLNLLNIRFKEKSPSAYIQELNIKLGNIKNMIQKEIKTCLNRNLIFIQEYEKNLEILNPLSILDRGYSIIQNQSGKSIKSNADVKIGENLTARLNKGFIDIEVKNKKDGL